MARLPAPFFNKKKRGQEDNKQTKKMKDIKLGDKEYAYTAPLGKLNRHLMVTTKGKYNIGKLGMYLEDDMLEAVLDLIVFGINNAGKTMDLPDNKMTKKGLEEVIGSDFQLVAELVEFLMKFFKLDKDQEKEEAEAESGN